MSSPYVPNDPISAPLRPLNKGMMRNLSPTQMPDGSGWTVEGFIVTQQGLRRRPGWQTFANSATIASLHQPFRDIATVWTSAGSQHAIAIGEKFVYQIGLSSGYTGKYWTYGTGNVASISGSTIYGTSTVWNTAASELQAGDTILFSDGTAEYEISSITSNTLLTVTESPAASYSYPLAYKIRRALNVPVNHLVDWTVVDYKLVIADGSRFLYAYDPAAGTFGDFASAETYIPRCVLFFADRVWIGNVTEGAAVYRQRIRWSSATARTSFAAADYYDIPYSAGGIMRLMPLNNLMIVYLEDRIFYGRPTNLVDLPYAFNPIESGKKGLVGTKAVCSWLGANFFVAQDDIYVLDSELKMTPIGTPVVKETLGACSNLSNIYVDVDPNNERIVFGFPESGSNISKIWSYDYKANSWSYEEKESTMLSSAIFDLSYTWTDLATALATDSWDVGMATFASWDSLVAGKTKRRLFRGTPLGAIEQCSDSAATDVGSIAPTTTFESGDLDFGEPELDKCVTRLSAKIVREAGTTGAMSIVVFGSRNSGGSWMNLGTISLAADKSEGFVNFRMTGSMFRFKLVSTSNISPYVVTEIVLRVRGRGLETRNV